MDTTNFHPETDEDVQEALDHLRYSEEAHLGIISPKTQLNVTVHCIEHLLKRIQQLESKTST